MKIIILVFMIGLFVVPEHAYDFRNAGSFASLWQQGNSFTSIEGRFSVVFPAVITRDKIKFDRTKPDGSGRTETGRYTATDSGNTYILVYHDIAPKLFDTKTIQQMLEDGRDGAIKNINGSLVNEKLITISGRPGMTMILKAENNGFLFHIRCDVVIAKPRLYVYMYIALNESDLERADIKAFFNSFKIKKAI